MEGAESVTIALHGSMTVDVSLGSSTDLTASKIRLPLFPRKRIQVGVAPFPFRASTRLVHRSKRRRMN